jgi:hypothetical protein
MLGEVVDSTGCSCSQRDSDGDGVNDCVDACPNTPAGVAVDVRGCPIVIDSDGDGDPDDTDCEPFNPAVHHGAVELCNGIDDNCNGQVDEGVVCVVTLRLQPGPHWKGGDTQQPVPYHKGATATVFAPAAEAGYHFCCWSGDASGSANPLDIVMDRDKTITAQYAEDDDDDDGVPNSADLCAGTPAGEQVDAYGCSECQLDDDDDGVPNCRDLCPNSNPSCPVDQTGCSSVGGMCVPTCGAMLAFTIVGLVASRRRRQ